MHIKKHIVHLTITTILLGVHALLISITDSKITTFNDSFLAVSIYFPLIVVKELGYSSKNGWGFGIIDFVIIGSVWFLIYLFCVIILSKLIRKCCK